MDLCAFQRRIGDQVQVLQEVQERLQAMRAELVSQSCDIDGTEEEARQPPTVLWVIHGALDCVLEADLPKVIGTLRDASQVTQPELDEQWRREAAGLESGERRPGTEPT